MAEEVGKYELKGSGISFWPLKPGTTVAQAKRSAGVRPLAANAPNSVVIGTIGIMDIVVLLPLGGPIKRTTIPDPPLRSDVSGPRATSATLLADGYTATLCFAVTIPQGAAHFEGTLVLQTEADGHAITSEIPVHIGANATVNDVFVAIAMVIGRRAPAKELYAWLTIGAVKANDGSALSGATVSITYLRDNHVAGHFNRSYRGTTSDTGLVQRGDGRTRLAVLVDFPALFEFRDASIVRRAHLIEVTAAQRRGNHNGNPIAQTNARVTPIAAASLAGKTIVLDPGHGLAYGGTERRSQEWFVAHQTARRVAEILQTRHSADPSKIKFTRSAGIALIDPDKVDTLDAPEQGKARYEIDLNDRLIHSKLPAVSLKNISDLLLVRHSEDVTLRFVRSSEPPTVEERQSILAASSATVTAIVARATARFRGHQVVPNSARWEEGSTNNYVFSTVNAKGETADHPLPISTTDKFKVTDPMLAVLIARTARWSLNQEVAGMTGRSRYGLICQQELLAAGALQYMQDQALDEATRPHNDPFLTRGNLGWTFGVRRDYMTDRQCRPHGRIAPQCLPFRRPHVRNCHGARGPVALDRRAHPATEDLSQVRQPGRGRPLFTGNDRR